MVPTCRHCCESPVSRPRGLCWGCYYADGVKGLYPAASKSGRRGVAGIAPSAADPVPCPHPPGSAGRVATYARRAAAGLVLFHPLDGRA